MKVISSAPAKVILFGEHAVVYGKPAIAMAIDLRMEVAVRPAVNEKTTVDNRPLTKQHHAYIKYAMDNYHKGPPLEFTTRSKIPSASGLGSSAALTIATLGAIKGLEGPQPKVEEVAMMGHDTEYGVQGAASPTDTTTSAYGGGILVSNKPGDGLLWHAQKGQREWYLHRLDIPEDLTLVVGYSGASSKTSEQIKKVRHCVERSKFGRELMDEIGGLVDEARRALAKKDLVGLGALMNRNHSLLTMAGASSDALQALIDATAAYCFGAKLTGAGGGGSVIALTDQPEKVASLFEKRKARAYIVKCSKTGLSVTIHEEKPAKL